MVDSKEADDQQQELESANKRTSLAANSFPQRSREKGGQVHREMGPKTQRGRGLETLRLGRQKLREGGTETQRGDKDPERREQRPREGRTRD